MKLILNIPKTSRTTILYLEAVRQTQVSAQAVRVLDAIFDIISRGVDPSVQQVFFDTYGFESEKEVVPVQTGDVVALNLEIRDAMVAELSGQFLDVSMSGSEWIRKRLQQEDAAEAIIFEVICDILEERLPPHEQEALLKANLDVAQFS